MFAMGEAHHKHTIYPFFLIISYLLGELWVVINVLRLFWVMMKSEIIYSHFVLELVSEEF